MAIYHPAMPEQQPAQPQYCHGYYLSPALLAWHTDAGLHLYGHQQQTLAVQQHFAYPAYAYACHYYPYHY